jgi:ParB/RepB/Spo0J family partition protein
MNLNYSESPKDIREVRVDLIEANLSFNSRSDLPKIETLAENISEVGLLQPIIIRAQREMPASLRLEDGKKPYAVIAGFRRFAAVQRLGWEWIPALILDVDESRAKLINLAENVERQDLRLYDFMRTISALAESLKVPKISKETSIPELKVYRLARIWPKLADSIKEQWSAIEDKAWEPSLQMLDQLSRLSWSEQKAAWAKWAPSEKRDEINELKGEITAKARQTKRLRRPIKEIRSMIQVLGKSNEDQAQRRALLWVIGKRNTL